MIDAESLIELDESGERALVLTVLEGPRVGAKALVRLGGRGRLPTGSGATAGADRTAVGATFADGPPAVIEGDADLPGLESLVRRGAGLVRSTVLLHGDIRVLVDVFGPPVRLIVVGAYDVGEELCALAKRLGWSTAALDARDRYATAERLPSADVRVVAWPEEGLAQLAPDAATAVVVLTHDYKFDVPALCAAVRTPAFYVGALGSRRNQERRRPRLLEAGLTVAEIDRIAGPCGLDLGGETPTETALSIVAEIVAWRNGRTGGPLRTGCGSIHGDEPPPAALALGGPPA